MISRYTLICLLALSSTLYAETIQTSEDSWSLLVVKISATPADAPSPLLKYRFALQPSQTTPGNAAADYRRAFPEHDWRGLWKLLREKYPSKDDKGGKEGVSGYDEWFGGNVPIHEVPVEKVKDAANRLNGIIDAYIRPGTSRRRCEWDLPTLDLSGPELVGLALPEFQGMRQISRAVGLQITAALCEHDFDKAIDLIRMNYTLGQHTGKEPILVCTLVGMAICRNTNDNALDLIGCPDSPNLYWALTNLPTPLVPLREAIAVEMEFGIRTMPFLMDAEQKSLSYDEWNARWKRGARILRERDLWADEDERRSERDMIPVAVGLLGYTHAKSRLVDWGYEPTEVEAMPVGQVLAIYSRRAFRTAADHFEVISAVPYADAKELSKQAERVFRNRGPLSDHPDRELIPIGQLLLPASSGVRRAEVRLDRQVAAIRLIEALRMHAARNEGKLPSKLDELTCVPVPRNPATGKRFEYELAQIDGKPTAVISCPKSEGITPAVRYELSIRPSGDVTNN